MKGLIVKTVIRESELEPVYCFLLGKSSPRLRTLIMSRTGVEES